MSKKLISKIVENTTKGKKHNSPIVLDDIKLKTDKKNQLLAFFKPEVFLDKTPEQIEKILKFAFKKLEEHEVSIDGAALFPGSVIKKYKIMDRHYGVINTLSKNASKILSTEEKDLIFSTLGVKNGSTRILGGHEAYEISGMGQTYDFDKYWLSTPSNKIKSGFYIRSMKLKDEEAVVVNGFHPHQLAHYTEDNRFLAVLVVSSNTNWNKLRTEMLGESFPAKALPNSIRGFMYSNPEDFGFKSVGIENNIMHLSAGPTEALFEMNNFFNEALGIDIIEREAKLAQLLLLCGFKPEKIKELLQNKEIHGMLEHKDTDEAIEIIKKQFS